MSIATSSIIYATKNSNSGSASGETPHISMPFVAQENKIYK